MTTQKKPTDWRKRFQSAKAPKVVMLHTDFAGIKAGMDMLISSPEDIAGYITKIPHGQTRTIARLRADLSRAAKADAMCPVTTAIYLRIVAENALRDLSDGKDLDDVVPFWRVIELTSKIAGKLSCGRDGVEHLLRLDGYEVSIEAGATTDSRTVM
jgi:hypothetical protein